MSNKIAFRVLPVWSFAVENTDVVKLFNSRTSVGGHNKPDEGLTSRTIPETKTAANSSIVLELTAD